MQQAQLCQLEEEDLKTILNHMEVSSRTAGHVLLVPAAPLQQPHSHSSLEAYLVQLLAISW